MCTFRLGFALRHRDERIDPSGHMHGVEMLVHDDGGREVLFQVRGVQIVRPALQLQLAYRGARFGLRLRRAGIFVELIGDADGVIGAANGRFVLLKYVPSLVEHLE
ncbi:hypothetical protein [Paenibacillus sp.]|uniref:hypothetical protein n=1 Tax=Paenibacillus sp. TaxID=58172 RepID=UPI0028118152|nr:hypothetical protein [Paenibacillus sp.]